MSVVRGWLCRARTKVSKEEEKITEGGGEYSEGAADADETRGKPRVVLFTIESNPWEQKIDLSAINRPPPRSER